MGRAEDLFEKIKSEKLDAIHWFIHERFSEELYLDFKRSANNGESLHLHENDKNNYSKAISGFGNSEGGLIVWGVDCSKNKEGEDFPDSIIPIENPKRFESNLNSITSGRTLPHHHTVENYSFEIERNKGIVVTLIPKSLFSPLQSVFDRLFYVRIGSSFEKATYSFLEYQFSKKPTPQIILMYTHQKFRYQSDTKSIRKSYSFLLTNVGSTVIRNMYMILEAFQFLGSEHLLVKPLDLNNWIIHNTFGCTYSFISKDGHLLAPQSHVSPAYIDVNFQLPFSEDINYNLIFGCDNSPSFKANITAANKIKLRKA